MGKRKSQEFHNGYLRAMESVLCYINYADVEYIEEIELYVTASIHQEREEAIEDRAAMDVEEPKDFDEVFSRFGGNMAEFSRITGIPYRTVQDWKSGKRHPPAYVVRLLSLWLR